MSTYKFIDRICIVVIIASLILTIVFMNGASLGISATERVIGYENRLFDTSSVHTIDIVMDDWDSFIADCESEEYYSCAVVVDGEYFKNVAIRAKGNTSLSSVRSMGSERYSFKLEFDHYDKNKSYHGLDKLCLNNLIQDNSMMKDYLAYQMMYGFGVDSPLSSYVYITVNGEDWGLYLAVEGIEDSFLERNYGNDIGNLYKPDSLSFGGGRGNGRDFKMEDLDFSEEAGSTGQTSDVRQKSDSRKNFSFGGKDAGGVNFGGGFGMGSDDVKLKYIDEDPDSYSNIFNSAKTDVTTKDKNRLISSLKDLSSYENLEEVLDMDEVLRYFVVHNFVINGDSYTGSMIHNYYLHEDDGQLAMIPWDYNLAYGTFMGGDAASQVNSSIDSPVSGSMDDRPMVGWIFSDEKYTEMYHELFAEFIEEWFDSGKLADMIADTIELIRPCVVKDPTKFCTTEEFDEGAAAIAKFVELRAEAVRRQLDGDSTKVETDGLNLSVMGTMNSGGGRGGFGGFSMDDIKDTFGDFSRDDIPDSFGGFSKDDIPDSFSGFSMDDVPDNFGGFSMDDVPDNFGGFPGGSMPGGFGGFSGRDGSSDESGGFPGGNMPGGFEGRGGFSGGEMPSGFGGAGRSSAGTSAWLLVGISAVVLAIGIFIVKKKEAKVNVY